MAQNRMADVAAMFGKKLNQRFVVTNICGDYRPCIFCEEGLKTEAIDGKYYIDNSLLGQLLVGHAYIYM